MRASTYRRLGAALVAGAAVALTVTSGPATAATGPAHPTPLSASTRTAHPEVVGARLGAAAEAATAGQAGSFLAAHAGLLPADAPARARTVAPAASIHPAQGTGLIDTGGTEGVFAAQTASTDVHPTNGGTTIYTPTLYPAGGSCIEVSTVYTTNTQAVEAWDWCNNINFEAAVPIDAGFVSRYTNGGAYTAEILRTDAGTNTWTAILYDYATGAWDTLYTSSGSSQAGTTGWDVNELYSDLDGSGQSYACADLAGKTFSASNIQADLNGAWTAAGPGNANTEFDQPAANFDCSSMSYRMINQYDNWQVTG
jgi:hypothetical protein